MSFVKEFNIKPRKKLSDADKKKAEDLRQKARDTDIKMVTGIFKNIEVPKGDVSFTYRIYKEDNYQTYHLEDGKTYTIPLGVAKYINNMTAVPEREYAINEKGEKQLYTIIKSKRQRYQFLSTEYM